MPLQNRVTPEGLIVADPARGLMMGNRGGALHDESRTLRRRRWVSKQWICCVLAFRERHRQVMSPGRYTELFFLDEATALAAGHRPCFECRRQDAVRFAQLWAGLADRNGRAMAGEMDEVLHGERVDKRGAKVTHMAPLSGLPTGTFVQLEGRPHLVIGNDLAAWRAAGYCAPAPWPRGRSVEVLTPRSMVAVMAAGYKPALHPSVMASASGDALSKG